ncbi:MAG: NAD(P)H-dependent oxidoreductase [Pseudomonadota bacterium]
MTKNSKLNVLRIDSSARIDDSQSRHYTDEAVAALRERYDHVDVVQRDIAVGLPFVDQDWVGATFTPEHQRTDAQRAALSESDTLVEELERADLVIIGLPMYNFGVPATLKAWMDLVARAGRTFRYTDTGPEGLISATRAWLVVASGGVPINAPVDFATPHLTQFLNFLGIDDVSVIPVAQLNVDPQTAQNKAQSAIHALTTAPALSEVQAAS